MEILLYFFLVLAEEEISTMQKELEKYGINMPSFGKIGGILANEVLGLILVVPSSPTQLGRPCFQCGVRVDRTF